MAALKRTVEWFGKVPEYDVFGNPIEDEFVDAPCGVMLQWGLMSPLSYRIHGRTRGKLGIGLGQRYKKQPDGRWLKVEG